VSDRLLMNEWDKIDVSAESVGGPRVLVWETLAGLVRALHLCKGYTLSAGNTFFVNVACNRSVEIS
jgi:hypothetical protein